MKWFDGGHFYLSGASRAPLLALISNPPLQPLWTKRLQMADSLGDSLQSLPAVSNSGRAANLAN